MKQRVDAAVTEHVPHQDEAKSSTPTIDELKQQVQQLKIEQQQQSAARQVKQQLEADAAREQMSQIVTCKTIDCCAHGHYYETRADIIIH